MMTRQGWQVATQRHLGDRRWGRSVVCKGRNLECSGNETELPQRSGGREPSLKVGSDQHSAPQHIK